jgi:hypothetical protein
VDCNDDSFCNGLEGCDRDLGGCVNAPAPSCNDNDTCTQDQCAIETGLCLHTLSLCAGSPCDTNSQADGGPCLNGSGDSP